MSLEHFEVKGNIFHPILAVGFINFILMIDAIDHVHDDFCQAFRGADGVSFL